MRFLTAVLVAAVFTKVSADEAGIQSNIVSAASSALNSVEQSSLASSIEHTAAGAASNVDITNTLNAFLNFHDFNQLPRRPTPPIATKQPIIGVSTEHPDTWTPAPATGEVDPHTDIPSSSVTPSFSACEADITTYCSASSRHFPVMIDCLSAHISSISTSCSSFIHSLPKFACATEIDTYCSALGGDRKQMKHCLEGKSEQLSQTCRDSLARAKAWKDNHKHGRPHHGPRRGDDDDNNQVTDPKVACRADAQNLCSSFLHGDKHGLKRCMKQNWEQLSSDCQTAIQNKHHGHGHGHGHHRRPHRPTPLPPTLSPEHDPRVQCRDDAVKYCSASMGNAADMINCMTEHYNELSSSCVNAIEYMQNNRDSDNKDKKKCPVREACASDATQYCSSYVAAFDNGDRDGMKQCIKTHWNQLSSKCQNAIIAMKKRQSHDDDDDDDKASEDVDRDGVDDDNDDDDDDYYGPHYRHFPFFALVGSFLTVFLVVGGCCLLRRLKRRRREEAIARAAIQNLAVSQANYVPQPSFAAPQYIPPNRINNDYGVGVQMPVGYQRLDGESRV